MSIETIISLGALIVAIAGAIYSGRKSSADIAKTKLETEQLLRRMLDEETVKRSNLETKINEMNTVVVTMEGQLRERDELVEDFREYVSKLVIIMRAAHLDVPQFQPRKRQ